MTTERGSTGYEFKAASGEADSLCVMFHGYGADGSDMMGLAMNWSVFMPNTHFVAPDALDPCPGQPGYFQWYDMPADRQTADAAVTQLNPLLDRYIDAQLARIGVADERLIIVGFSQGGGVAIQAALHREKTPAALVSFTSALRNQTCLPEDITSKPPTLIVHGEDDEFIPVRHAYKSEELLKSLGVPTMTYVCKGLGHGISEEGIVAGAMFAADIIHGYGIPEEIVVGD